jgi:phosphoribosylformimino-5-aminoimidazole carboxamide ribotide isomerase
MLIVPAIDLRGGKVVRLCQGDFARETVYPIEPLLRAHEIAAAGAQWLHIVDLDGARSGNLENLRAIAAIAAGGIKVQAGGGVRNLDDVKRLFDHGVARVVLGSLAVRECERVCAWLANYGAERLCIALDTRFVDGEWRLPVSGWTQEAAATLDELAPRYAAAGARHLLCTDIDRDGMLTGPNLTLYRHLAQIAPTLSVQASGGIRDIADLHALQEAGAAAAILGRSLLEGTLSLEQALAC